LIMRMQPEDTLLPMVRGSRRRGVDHVGPAVFLAQAMVDRPRVEEQETARPSGTLAMRAH